MSRPTSCCTRRAPRDRSNGSRSLRAALAGEHEDVWRTQSHRASPSPQEVRRAESGRRHAPHPLPAPPVGKDTLHDYLAHLEDAFLVRTVAMHSASERQPMVNPRKAYPVDPGLIRLFERSGRTHHGRALETAILIELERRGYEVAYVRTSEGHEVDFFAQRAGDAPLLIQSCLESEGDETWTRELRALEAAAADHPGARPFLVTLDAVPPSRPLPEGLTWAPAARWLLEEM